MLIQSNFKDYYDHLQGIYGVDEKVVYERVCSEKWKDQWKTRGLFKPKHIEFPSKDEIIEVRLALGGTMIAYFIFQGTYYFGDEGGERLYEVLPAKLRDNWRQGWYYNPKNKPGWSYRGRDYRESCPTRGHMQPTEINRALECPVVLKYDYQTIKNPRLSDLGVPQLLSAQETYLMISNFLTQEKPVVDTRTDTQKLTGHGFDKKTSFRHPIK